ncbi:Endo-beta-mannanase [Lysinibacillus sphaericus]|nr:Endo-beta-mannanase [Lysinibacillus sphaericus]
MTQQLNKKFMAVAAAVTLTATAIVPVASASGNTDAFTDVPASYKDAVDYVVSNNISVGLSATQYGVNQQIKRVDAAAMIATAAGLTNQDALTSGFTDVPARAATAVNSLKAAGVVSGKSTTTFGAQDNITRGEVAIMLTKAFDLKAGNKKNSFTDVSSRYDTAVDALVGNHVTNGINATQFGTQNQIKRGDFAKFLVAFNIHPITQMTAMETVALVDDTTKEQKDRDI